MPPKEEETNLLESFVNPNSKKTRRDAPEQGESKTAAAAPSRSGRTTRGIKLGNLNENALAKNSAAVPQPPSGPGSQAADQQKKSSTSGGTVQQRADQSNFASKSKLSSKSKGIKKGKGTGSQKTGSQGGGARNVAGGSGHAGKKPKTQKEIDRELRQKYDRGNAYSEDEDEKADRKKTTVGGLGNSSRYGKRASHRYDPDAEMALDEEGEIVGGVETEEGRRFNEMLREYNNQGNMYGRPHGDSRGGNVAAEATLNANFDL